MRYGPLKPVGIFDPRLGDHRDPENRAKRPYAVVQLRQEDRAGQLWNMVGFQTNLRWGEQKRVFRLIPGLEEAEFVRMGVMHRNTFINAPELLYPTLQFKKRLTLLAAGQLIGTEGYTAAAAGGWLAGFWRSGGQSAGCRRTGGMISPRTGREGCGSAAPAGCCTWLREPNAPGIEQRVCRCPGCQDIASLPGP